MSVAHLSPNEVTTISSIHHAQASFRYRLVAVKVAGAGHERALFMQLTFEPGDHDARSDTAQLVGATDELH
jgi:hypothetical protein